MNYSLIIPTYNERDNIIPLVERIHRALASYQYEILFVDDNSRDGTADTISALAPKYPVRVLVRKDKRGLATAVTDGFLHTSSDVIGVMDADLQHPPEVLPSLVKEIEKGKDMVVASRYVPGGGCEGWKLTRRIMSKGAILLAHTLLPATRACHDPMSGFFMLRRRVIEKTNLTPIGYKILLEILMMGDYKSLGEIPYIFVARTRGESKLSIRQQREYLKHLLSLMHRKGEDRRIVKFLMVGVSGIVVNEGLLYLLKELVGLALQVANAISIEASILSNFLLNDTFTFRDRRTGKMAQFFSRLLKFNMVSLVGAVINYAVTLFLAQLLGLRYYLIFNLIGIAIATAINYLFSTWWTWR